MNTFVLEIWYDEGSVCTFYSVKVATDDDDAPMETDRFFDIYASDEHSLKDEALQLFRLITHSIGDKYGATDDFFDRSEQQAQALPPKPKKRVEEIKAMDINFPLRLYCYRISEQIVILFNGGVKEARTAQESKTLSMKFFEAQTFVKRIEEALRAGMIEIAQNGRYLKNFDGSTDLII